MSPKTADFIARSSITISAPPERVWQALLDPAAIKQYMFGTDVTSDWREGSPITWKGEWQGKNYEDKGVIKKAEPSRALQFTHFSPLAGLPDRPENYHTVTIQLSREGEGSRVSISQDNNPTEDAKAHSESNWSMVLSGLKRVVEG